MALYCPRMKPLLPECLLPELALEIEHIKPARTAHALKEITPLAQVEKRKSNKNRYLIIGAVFRSSAIGFVAGCAQASQALGNLQPLQYGPFHPKFSVSIDIILYNRSKLHTLTMKLIRQQHMNYRWVSRKSDIEVIAVKHIVF